MACNKFLKISIRIGQDLTEIIKFQDDEVINKTNFKFVKFKVKLSGHKPTVHCSLHACSRVMLTLTKVINFLLTTLGISN